MATTTKPRATTTRKATAPKAEAKPKVETPEEETKAQRTTVSAPTQFDRVMGFITKAGEEGITLKDLSEKTGLPYRVVHNVTWRLEGSPAIKDNASKGIKIGDVQKADEVRAKRVGKGRTVRYAAV